jgi:tetratricopeptide (TPR) repeat protein
MKKYLLSFSFAVLVATASFAQRTPQPSSSSSIVQTVGITDFTVKYSRPGIKGRSVFGDNTPLAPLGKLWRTGANQSTILESSTDFNFGGKTVAAGKYALFSIPDKAKWIVILNKNLTGGTEGYKESDDAARVEVAPLAGEFKETFEINFANVSDSTTHLNIEWGAVKIPVQLSVATHALTLASLDKAVQEKPEDVQTLQSAAGYLLLKNQELPKALALADKAIGLKESWSNQWIKAQILEKMGKTTEALPAAQKAITLGNAAPDGAFNFYKTQIAKSITEMQAKAPAVDLKSKAKKKKK